MISLKSDVNLLVLKPQTVLAMLIAEGVYSSQGCPLNITSVCDGKHMDKSLHYTGDAFDCHILDIPLAAVTKIMMLLKQRLTAEYDIVLEKDHIHIEYDAKKVKKAPTAPVS